MLKKLVIMLWLAISSFAFAVKPYVLHEKINGVNYESTFNEAPKRAVSISQFTTEMMLALGLQKNMVGTAFLEEQIYPSVAKSYAKVPVLAKKWPSMEKLLSVKPDFVTGWEVALKKGDDSKVLAKHGIAMFVPRSSIELDANLDTLFNDFLTFGKIFRQDANAKKYVEKQKLKLAKIQKNYVNGKTFTYFLYDSGTDKPFTVYEGFTTNLLKMIGGQNILSGLGVKKTWGQTSWEPVIAKDPDFIIVVDYTVAIRKETNALSKIKALKNNPITKNLSAVKNNKFIIVKLADICPGIRNIAFLEKASKVAYK